MTTIEAENYVPLTIPYHLPEEGWMLDNVINDLVRGGIKYALVEQEEGIEVWRTKERAVMISDIEMEGITKWVESDDADDKLRLIWRLRDLIDFERKAKATLHLIGFAATNDDFALDADKSKIEYAFGQRVKLT